MRKEQIIRQGNGTKCGINLHQIKRKGKLGGKDLFESQCMQKDGNADGSQVKQEHAMDKLPLSGCIKSKIRKIVDKESQKVLGPKKEDFNGKGSNGVESFVSFGATLFGVSSIAEASHGKEETNGYIGPKDECQLNKLSTKAVLPIFSNRMIVVKGSKNRVQSEENVLVNKVSRDDSLI